MFIPLHDANTLKHIKVQWVTLALMTLNIAVWLLTSLESEQAAQATTVGLGYIPAIAFGHAVLAQGLEIVPEPLTYLTYAFVHTGFWHLAGNMIFLWVFGDNVEDAMGHLRFLIFYLVCAAAGALCHGLLTMTSEAPLVGASGRSPASLPPMSCCIRASGSGCWCFSVCRCPCRPSCRCFCGSGSSSSCWRSHLTATFPGARMSAASLPGLS